MGADQGNILEGREEMFDGLEMPSQTTDASLDLFE